MAQGISKGSREAQQFLKDSLHSNLHIIEGKSYKERAQFGENVLRSLFQEDELFHFKKTALKNRAVEDKTRSIEAIEHQAELMLNGMKAHSHDNKIAMHVISSIQNMFSAIKPSELNAIKNPILRSLASTAQGGSHKKEALAYFAKQVLLNPTYFFEDIKQARPFVRLFLRKNGLGRLARMLRCRGQRSLNKVMDKLSGISEFFEHSTVKKKDSDIKKSAIPFTKSSEKDQLNKKKKYDTNSKHLKPETSLPTEMKSAPMGIAEAKRDAIPTVHPVVNPNIPPAPALPNHNLFHQPAPIPDNTKSASIEIDDLDKMLAELNGDNLNTTIPDAPPLPGPHSPVNVPPSGNIPPAPPPPPLSAHQSVNNSPKGNTGLKAEAIANIDTLIPIKAATANSRPSVEKCTIDPVNIDKVAPAIFEDLSIERMLKLMPEHVAHLTYEQQAALSPELVGDLCYKAAKEGRLSLQEAQESRLCRKLLVCLDVELVKEKLNASTTAAHAVYLQENNIHGKAVSKLESLYKAIRRDDFGLPYEHNEAIARLTPEQIAAFKHKQAAESSAGRSSLLDRINQGGFKLKSVATQSQPADTGRPDEAEDSKGSPKIAGGIGFNMAGFDKYQKMDVEEEKKIENEDKDFTDSQDEDWEDSDIDNGDTSKASDALNNSKKEPLSENNNAEPHPQIANNPGPEASQEHKIEKNPALSITESATKAIDIQFKVGDIQKNGDIQDTIRRSLDEILNTREELQMPELSEQELKALKIDLEGIALNVFRENKEDWLNIAELAARKTALQAVEAGIALGKTAEEIQTEANRVAQDSAEKALIKHLQELVETRKDRMTQELSRKKVLEGRRRNIEEDDEPDNEWDD